jgi:hypothetical protein
MKLLLFMLACGGGDALAPLAPPEAEVVLRVAEKKVGEGDPVEVVVEAIASEGWSLDVGVPGGTGLTPTLVGTEGPIHVGERQLSRWHYELSGDPGSYVIALGPSTGSGPADQRREFSPPPVFVDIGLAGPSGGPMAGFQGAPAQTGWHWTTWLAIGAGGLAILGLLLWLVRRMARSAAPVEPPPDPPHIIALREWEAARSAGLAGELDDAGLALEQSRVLRAYLQSICAWPATARTTREILAFLEREGAGARRLDVTDRMRTGRILDATDRLKFAREGGGEPFFAALDHDFRAVVDATCPLGMTEVSNA